MKFKTDENLPEEAAELLRSAGYDASTILEQSMGGELDPEVASVCRREQRTLVTLDLGFADIRTYPPEEYHDLIVLRLRQQDKVHVVGVIEHYCRCWRRSRLRTGCGLWKRNESGLEVSITNSTLFSTERLESKVSG